MGNADIVLRALRAVEDRRLEDLHALYHPEIEFHWQPGLPYSGDYSGSDVVAMSETFDATWAPLQPDMQIRRMGPTIVAAQDKHVVASYRWRGIDGHGNKFETATLAHYQVEDGRLRDARMFYYDLAGLISFLGQARA
jgi:ketosteroid isomerase-like protein